MWLFWAMKNKIHLQEINTCLCQWNNFCAKVCYNKWKRSSINTIYFASLFGDGLFFKYTSVFHKDFKILFSYLAPIGFQIHMLQPFSQTNHSSQLLSRLFSFCFRLLERTVYTHHLKLPSLPQLNPLQSRFWGLCAPRTSLIEVTFSWPSQKTPFILLDLSATFNTTHCSLLNSGFSFSS